ncbi:TPA: hypothetical protein ACH3X1_015296 [Trebouxia sp. C0004]
MRQVQEEMLGVHWREDVLTHCQAPVWGKQGLSFVGPRIKMGVYEGVPTRVAPHTNGSADYFGPLVNRAARFCTIDQLSLSQASTNTAW